MLFLTDFKGEIAALSVAFLWAVTSVVYSRLGKKIPPVLMNLSKGGIAIALIILTILVSGQQLFPNISTVPFLLLLLSGAVGIGVGDTAYFSALNRLGARRTLFLKTLGPPFAAIVSAIFLKEQLSYTAWIAILLTVLGISSSAKLIIHSETLKPLRSRSVSVSDLCFVPRNDNM